MDSLILDLIDVDESEPFVWTDHVIGPNSPCIVSTIKAMASTCLKCKKVVYYSLKVWNSKQVCVECWKYEQEVVSEHLHSFLKEQYTKGCEFCGVKKVSTERFHFDHKNMFTKNYNVGYMIENGCSKADLVAEIDKCQLLCISCHAIVTKMEHRYGFMIKKRKFNKILQKKLTSKVEDYRKSLAEEYDSVMIPLYDTIRKIVRGEL
jgi:hypothetical protein